LFFRDYVYVINASRPAHSKEIDFTGRLKWETSDHGQKECHDMGKQLVRAHAVEVLSTCRFNGILHAARLRV